MVWWVIIPVGVVVGAYFVRNLGKAASVESPTSPAEQLFYKQQKCHYCDKGIDIHESWLRRNCPYCHAQDAIYHGGCGSSMHNKQPHCHGIYVGHATGHTVSLNPQSRNMCTQCGLAREYWEDWYCASGVKKLVASRVRFTAKDKAWLRDLHVTTDEVAESSIQ